MRPYFPIRIACTLTMVAGIALQSCAAPDERTAWAQPAVIGSETRSGCTFFDPNMGQCADETARFMLHRPMFSIACRDSAISLTSPGTSRGNGIIDDRVTISLTFPGSNPVPPQGSDPNDAVTYYNMIVDDVSVCAAVPQYETVTWPNLYEGIDLALTCSPNGTLKYEFHCAPGADYKQIRVRIDGLEGDLCLDETDGSLVAETTLGPLHDRDLLVWQETGNNSDRQMLSARHEVIDHNTYTFSMLDEVDPTLPLVIDPVVEWMIYAGGTDWEEGYGVAVNPDGSSVITGSTESLDFEGRSNERHGDRRDAYVAKVSADGTLEWMTYLGGTGRDSGYQVAIDSTGDILVTGDTASLDFEGHINNAHERYGIVNDIFLARLDSTGVLEWMIYLGGTGRDYCAGAGVGPDDAIYVAGSTSSVDLEGRINSYLGGEYDGFVASVQPDGTLNWSRYTGGSGFEYCLGLGIDPGGHPVICGETDSTDLEGRTNSAYGMGDAYMTRLQSDGGLDWSTYLGGSGDDSGWDLASDSTGTVYITGWTDSDDFAGRNNSIHDSRQDTYVARVEPDGSVAWMTYLGGTSVDVGAGIAIDGSDAPVVAGRTSGSDFEGRTNSRHGGYDGFAAKVSPDGFIQWMSYLGGSGWDEAWDVAVAADGHTLYLTGITESNDFEGAINGLHGGPYAPGDAFLLRLNPSLDPILTIDSSCPEAGPIHIAWSNATPDAPVTLLFALVEGVVTIPPGNPCEGTQLGLGALRLQVARSGISDADGTGFIDAIAPAAACGGYLQLIDRDRCTVSNVVRIN